jgi:flavorubredoxin
MSDAFKAVRIAERVYWVGAIDWSIRNFHGYQTSRGTTYNAFLVMGDPVILIDTVKAPFLDEMLARITSVVDPEKIHTIISNHTEMDHAGCLPRMIHTVHPEQVIASKNGAKALDEHFHWGREIRVVSDGEVLDLGDSSFAFAETRMLHWPDSMFTFLREEGVLFSSDAFGMHLASTERFSDEIDESVLGYEAAKYYANILLPFSPLVEKLLAHFPSLGWDVNLIAPDHGPAWRRQPGSILERYAAWAAQKPTAKAVVVYDTMWNSTARMAAAVGDGLAETGINVKLMPLGASHRSDVATELLDAGALIVGSPTMNNNLYPSLADAMTYLKGLRPRNLIGAAFGSYGWSGEAVKQLEQMLKDMGVELVQDGMRTKYVPDSDALALCREMGSNIGKLLKERLVTQ